MAIPNTTSQARNSPLTALFGLLPVLLCGDSLSEAAAQFGHLICALTCELLKFAPSIVWAGCYAVGSFILAHQQLLLCFQTLVSLRQLLHFLCGTA